MVLCLLQTHNTCDPTMFRSISRQVLNSRHRFGYLQRQLSQQTQSDTKIVQRDKEDEEVAIKEKIKTELLSQKSTDNFLIEFNQRKPTYDQIYEYQIDVKEHSKEKFQDRSFMSPDVKIFLHRKYDISYDAFLRFFKRYFNKYETKVQGYSLKRHGILGPDLATAHFILGRGGKVRFKHNPDVWLLDMNSLPKTFDKKYRLVSVDASNLNLMYNGLDNFILLHELEELHFVGNHKFDDFCCDKLARLFRNSKCLSYLDLSKIPDITHRGIEALYKIPSLRTLIIKDTKAASFPFIELSIHLFNEINPHCKIIYK